MTPVSCPVFGNKRPTTELLELDDELDELLELLELDDEVELEEPEDELLELLELEDELLELEEGLVVLGEVDPPVSEPL